MPTADKEKSKSAILTAGCDQGRDDNRTEAPIVPLCVDLDGTLIKTDTLVESFLVLAKERPGDLFRLPFWIAGGKARLKKEIADRVDLDVALLPCNRELVNYLQRQKEAGRQLALVTAANEKVAHRVAEHFELFDEVLASNDACNLRGSAKRDAMQTRYGRGGFDYAGNDRTDLDVWPHARKALLVNPDPGVKKAACDAANVTNVFDERPPRLKSLLRAMRIHQWLKNLLLFVPLVISHHVGDPRLLRDAFIGFLSFSLCASAVYLINDLLDLAADRKHPRKRLRPFAAGDLSLLTGLLLAPLLLAGAAALSVLLPPKFVGLLSIYVVSAFLYSIKLKMFALIDVLVLSGLYTLRLFAGGVATGITISFWLLAFSMFIFFSLAIIKRYSELMPLTERGNSEKIAGRGYQVADLEALRVFGTSSGYLAVLVMALYINSDQVKTLYRHPYVLWTLCPLILYWISRAWLLAGRGKMHEDPLLFALQDVSSLAVGLLALVFVLLAT